LLIMQDTLCGKEVPRFNEAALASVLADANFVEAEIRRLGKSELNNVFDEVKLVSERGDRLSKLNFPIRPSTSSYPTPSRLIWNPRSGRCHMQLSDRYD